MFDEVGARFIARLADQDLDRLEREMILGLDPAQVEAINSEFGLTKGLQVAEW